MNRNNINMTMRKHILSALLLSAALPVVAHAATLQDVWATAGSSRIHTANRVDAGIAAGSAPIEQALATLIPAPYRIELDSRVPNNWIVVWPAGQDWLSVLRAAVEPMGLRVVPEWSRGEIKIVMAQPHPASVPAAASSQATESAPVAPVPAKSEASLRPFAPRVTGADSAAWQTRIAAGGPIGLSSAIFRILPSDMVAANIEIVGLSDSQPVSWQAGSRRRALMEVVQAVHARAIVTPQNIRLEPTAAASDVEAAAGAHQRNPDSTVQNHNALSPQGGANSPGQMQRWSIGNGQSISAALKEWAQTAGWSVVWGLHDDWLAPHPTEFTGSFVDAVGAAINALAANGADIRADIYAGNHTIVIHPAGGEQTAGASTGDSN